MKPVERRLFLDRFLTYVKFDTQSSEDSTTYPSTSKQLELSKHLVKELEATGLEDVKMTKHGYVFGTLPANLSGQIPVIGLIAHVDTSPDVSGADVNPVINENFQGKPIVLKKDPAQIIDPKDNPALRNCIGHLPIS